MRIPFPYDVNGIYRKLLASACRHANQCKTEIVELRAQVMQREAEIERLRGLIQTGPGIYGRSNHNNHQRRTQAH